MSDVKKAVEELDGWELDGERIRKNFKFNHYLDGLDFVKKVGVYAEGAQHHPGISIAYTTVKISWITFSKKALTEKDITAAKACDNLYKLF
ncbi:4a-hydroxytetrahydrobiopterin dehydratase [Corticicoccus populi]|uniref:4a-hydroxytetrahydrobiopterin dehydratase n=1 Tax=Corticicoccus populi TaxID=1812821 RepID=A0ABW5WWU7_9STAP